MKRWWQRRLAPNVSVRIVADVLMVNAALLIALLFRYVWLVGVEDTIISPPEAFRAYARAYGSSSWFLTLVCLGVFYCSGFYTYGRIYRGRYKALVVAQAASISYLIFTACAFLLPAVIAIPRSVLLLAWGLTLVFLVGSRLWSHIWRVIVGTERQKRTAPAANQKVKHVLVIGGAGYIGSALLPKLLNKGYHVRLLDLLLFGEEPIGHFVDHPRLEIMQADFRQVDQVVQAMQGMDAVIHLGAIVGDPACALDEELTIDVNLMATRMIAEVAKGNGVNRFIFASTCSVYGASDEMLNERSLLNPVSLYARSKIASERVLSKMADELFAPVILRFGTIYGLSGRTRFDLVVNLLTAKAVTEKHITVFGGDQWRPFVHVDDAALAVLKALEAPLFAVRNRIFNVGSNEQNYTIQQVGELVQRSVPSARLTSMGSDSDNRNYRVDFSLIHNTLGFTPQWTVEQGIKQVIDAFNMGKIHDYKDARYSNVKFLSEDTATRLIRSESRWAYDLLDEAGSPSEILLKT